MMVTHTAVSAAWTPGGDGRPPMSLALGVTCSGRVESRADLAGQAAAAAAAGGGGRGGGGAGLARGGSSSSAESPLAPLDARRPQLP
jgi:hypothetical protein